MSSHPNIIPLPSGQISLAQTRIRRAIEELLVLAETTDIESWPHEMQANYQRAIDELAALEVSLHLYIVSLPEDGHSSSDGNGLSTPL